MRHEEVAIHTQFIKLDALLKFCGEAATGGIAKDIIAAGEVKVNGETCAMRGKKIYPGMQVELEQAVYTVVSA